MQKKSWLYIISIAAVILAAAFYFGGNTPNAKGWTLPSNDDTADAAVSIQDQYRTDPIPDGKPALVEPQDAVISDREFECTISVSCASILDNMEFCDPEKRELVPEDGWIIAPQKVVFYEGESVFTVLQRVCKALEIPMEFVNTPIYNSAYIEGISNLYEFDVGELSGWMYEVNGWFPNYGCSRYLLQNGDIIEWHYTCDLGADIGGSAAAGG